jgi:hypothetical protein
MQVAGGVCWRGHDWCKYLGSALLKGVAGPYILLEFGCAVVDEEGCLCWLSWWGELWARLCARLG